MSRKSVLRGQSRQPSLIVRGYHLTTAEILYHMPDHPSMLQAFIWQEYDLPPQFPILSKFLKFWHENLDGPLHSVRVGSHDLLTAQELRHVDFDFTLH